MLKHEEIADMDSCFNKADSDEMIFVLLGRDKAAPSAIFAWIETRIKFGLNKTYDPQIEEARSIATNMLLRQEGIE